MKVACHPLLSQQTFILVTKHLLSCRPWVVAEDIKIRSLLVGVVQLLSCIRLFVTPWTAAHHASLSFTISRSLLKLMSIELVMPSNDLILCHPLLLLPSVFPRNQGVF